MPLIFGKHGIGEGFMLRVVNARNKTCYDRTVKRIAGWQVHRLCPACISGLCCQRG